MTAQSARGPMRIVDAIGRRRLPFLSWVTGGHFVIHWYISLLSLVSPFIREDLGLTDVQVGTITTTHAGVGSGLMVASGYLSDTFRRQVSLMVSGAIVAVGVALFVLGVTHSYSWTLVAAGLLGLGVGFWHPAAMGSLSLRFPDRRGLALSVHGVGASVGDSLGPVIVGAILAVASWRVVIEYHLWPAVLIALLLWHGIRNDSVPAQDDSGASFRSYVSGIRDLVTNRQVLAVMLANALVNMARLAVMAFLPIYLKETLGFTAFTLGVFLSLLYVMGVVSQPAMGVLSDQFGRKVVLLPSSVAMGVLYLAIPFAGAGALLGIVIAALGMFFYPILNVMQAAIMDVADPGVQGSTMSVMSLFTQPFVLVSPVLAGFLVSAYGMESAFWYASAAALLSAVVLALVRLRRTV